MEDIQVLTRFITAWFWQVLAIIFLGFGCVFFVLPTNLKTGVFFVAFIVVALGCEGMALKRRKEVYGNA